MGKFSIRPTTIKRSFQQIRKPSKMKLMAMTFEYADPGHEQGEFVLAVPPGILSKAELLAALAEAGRFPGYFGNNWDALQDCLRDLNWIDSRKVVILHSDVPLQESPSECRIYLEILQTALDDWSQVAKPDEIEPSPEWPFAEHELRVVFPTEAHTAVARLTGNEF